MKNEEIDQRVEHLLDGVSDSYRQILEDNLPELAIHKKPKLVLLREVDEN